MIDETLKNTLPEGGLSLPDSTKPEDTLSLALKDLSNLAAREGKVKGTAATASFFEERGISPEDLPGSSVGQMLSFVDRAMVKPVDQRAESIGDILDTVRYERQRIQETAAGQIGMMMEQDVWNGLVSENPTAAKELWKASGLFGDPYKIPETPAQLNDVDIVPGYTPQESNDLYYKEDVQDWFIQDLLRELPQEELSRLSIAEPDEQGQGRSYSNIENSPKFQEFAQQQWHDTRRKMGGGSVPVDSLQTFSEQVAGTLKEQNIKIRNRDELWTYIRDINEEIGTDFGITELNRATDNILRDIPVTMSEQIIIAFSDGVYNEALELLEEAENKRFVKNVKEGKLKEKDKKILRETMIELVDIKVREWEIKKERKMSEETLNEIYKQISERYFEGEDIRKEELSNGDKPGFWRKMSGQLTTLPIITK
jgi:hypothetical protein